MAGSSNMKSDILFCGGYSIDTCCAPHIYEVWEQFDYQSKGEIAMLAKTYDRQSGKFIARIAENLPEMSTDVMQGWIDNPKGLQKFLEGLCPPVSEKKVIGIDRTKPFDPAFIDAGWSFWRGSADGNGLEGELEQDNRSLALTEVDTSKILLEARLESKETYTTGEERLKRLIAADRICLDFGIFQTLWNNKTLIPTRFREKTNNNRTYVFFDGQTLRSPGGGRCTLYLYLDGGGGWGWGVGWLGGSRRVHDPSVVLAS